MVEIMNIYCRTAVAQGTRAAPLYYRCKVIEAFPRLDATICLASQSSAVVTIISIKGIEEATVLIYLGLNHYISQIDCNLHVAARPSFKQVFTAPASCQDSKLL